ncbi:multidrug resistance protein Stp [Peptococcaceae bacterium CEB3]|nr:multidrug resistance protein Stp [Peptococcaceae bacterium CEB3]
MSLTENIKKSPHIRWFILANVALGTFMSTLDASIVQVALPTMAIKLHAGLAVLQWVVTAYLLTISSLLPIFGKLADMWGRGRLYLSGFVLFTLGSALCGLTNNIWFLVGMRVLQAVGASMLMANSQALIVAAFPLEERGRALGLSGTMVALGSLTGPALGGILVGLISWRAIFYVNVPIGIVAFLGALVILPNDNAKQESVRFDSTGSLLFALGMISLLYALNNGQDAGWDSAGILGAFALGLLLLAAFVWAERRTSDPIIDFDIYRNIPFLIGNLSAFLSFAGQFTYTMLMPFYLQTVLNYSATQVGLLMTAFPLAMAIAAPLSGYASDKHGPVALTTGGLATMALGIFYLVLLTPHSPFWQIVPGPLLMGIGAGMFNSPNNSSVMSSVPKSKLGIAGGLNALVRNVGMIVGTTLSVTLFEIRQAALLAGVQHPTSTQSAQAFMTSFRTVLVVGGVVLLAAAAVSINRRGYVSTSRPV